MRRGWSGEREAIVTSDRQALPRERPSRSAGKCEEHRRASRVPDARDRQLREHDGVEGEAQGARAREEVSSLEAHLGYWLRFVSNHVSHAFKVKVERHGVTVAEWVVMRALFDEDGIKPSELSEKIGLTRGAISKLLDRLANKNLVIIRGDAVDRRAQAITLSASGRRLVPKLAALADEAAPGLRARPRRRRARVAPPARARQRWSCPRVSASCR